ncbi:hypothetical protein R1flu_017031 [Riccia fluitans]|uniref:Uncharacterized protein n=1 Tax=Riccia fluitans TaxID=41844 RepID=A0ABD1YNL2_9MARC
MYIRGQSPRSPNCCGSLAPVAPLNPSIVSPKYDEDGLGPNTLYSSGIVTSRDSDQEIHHRQLLPGVVEETGFFAPKPNTKCGAKSNRPAGTGIFQFVVDEEEEENRFVSFLSPRKNKEGGFDTQGIGKCFEKEHQPTTDSTSVLVQHDWSASSSTDSLKSVNQDEESGEGNRNCRDPFLLHRPTINCPKNAAFYGSLSLQQHEQRGSSSIGLQRKWSDSSCSLDSIDQEEEEKFSNPNHRVRFEGFPNLMHRKRSSSNGSRDCLDSDEEEDSYQFAPLIEAVRVKEPVHVPSGETESPVLSLSSSIGNRSDDSTGSVVSYADSPRDMEAESTFRSNSASQMNLSSLESSLPIRRGLSKFWSGKAKSFACLQDVSSLASLADLAKPENPYSRRRRIASEFGVRSSSLLSRPSTSGISKKPPSGTGKSCLAVAVAIGNKLENGPKFLSPQSALRNAQRAFSLSDLEEHGSKTDPAPPHTSDTRMRQ